jgi:hypothetical protein
VATRDELYAKFGITAEAAQLFETELGTMLLALEGERRDWHVSPNPGRAAEFYSKLNKKTLGQIMEALKQYTPLDEDVIAKFNSALSARNRLNHGFFERHNFTIQTAEGRTTWHEALTTSNRPGF